jgi:hypothetical protein
VVPLSNQVTTLNHKRFKGFNMFSDGHLDNTRFRNERHACCKKGTAKVLSQSVSWLHYLAPNRLN